MDRFDKKGRIVLNTGAVLEKNHGHLAHGYCQTSHSSQSKSVRHVLVAQSESSFVASSQEQFYVSCSRGKETIHIYTDNRRGLQEAVGNTSTRMSGVELAELSQKDLSTFMSSPLRAKQWSDAIQNRRGLDESKTWVETVANQRKEHPTRKGSGPSWKGYIEMRRKIAGPDGKSRSKGHPTGKAKGPKARGRTLPKTSLLTTPVQERMLALHEAKKKAEAEKQPETRKSEAKETEEKKVVALHPKNVKKQEPISKPLPTPKLKRGSEEPAGDVRKKWSANMYQTAGENFNKVAAKTKGQSAAKETGKAKPTQPNQVKNSAPDRKIRMGGAEVKPLPQNNTKKISEHASKQKANDAGAAAQKQAALQKKIQAQKAPPPPKPKK